MALTKLVNGRPAIDDGLANALTLTCSQGERRFRLGYSDNEWNKVKDWLGIAERAIRIDHKKRHEVDSLKLEWEAIKRR